MHQNASRTAVQLNCIQVLTVACALFAHLEACAIATELGQMSLEELPQCKGVIGWEDTAGWRGIEELMACTSICSADTRAALGSRSGGGDVEASACPWLSRDTTTWVNGGCWQESHCPEHPQSHCADPVASQSKLSLDNRVYPHKNRHRGFLVEGMRLLIHLPLHDY